ncbi:MAG: hypothetical protein IT428_16095 [Planctomycetaceae bacterium]|nr:hypothetical protein [Planctomycetaceae bacterium]
MPWTHSDYTIDVRREELPAPAAWYSAAYDRTARRGFSAPGFCLLRLDSDATSVELRAAMWKLRREFARIHRERVGRHIVVASAGRFDQQETTKPHRDGAPDESLLVLGYEPSAVESEVALLDYSACAHAMGITPADFLDRHNPMFVRGAELLRPWTTPVETFASRRPQILVINNSMAAYAPEEFRWQGVLHTATIPRPDESQRRVINSMMLVSDDHSDVDTLSDADIQQFLTTTRVLRRGYARPELENDE